MRRILERAQYRPKLAALRKAIEIGDASGIARPGVFGRIQTKLNLPKRQS